MREPPQQHSSQEPEIACPYRQSVPGSENLRSYCDLLSRWLRIEDCAVTEIRRDACIACCAENRTTATKLNPVTASLLHAAAERIEQAEKSACDVRHVRRMVEWASLNLQTMIMTSSDRCSDDRVATDSSKPRLSLDDLRVSSSFAPPVRRWSVGVTTAPRRMPTLARCLSAISQAGWPFPWIFSDGECALPENFDHLPVTQRTDQVGAWPSYYLALQEMQLRDPDADAFMVVQDDAQLYHRENLRQYLESILWPSEFVGAVSLFCSSAYSRGQPGWYSLDEHWVWGALAFIFPAERLREFLQDPAVQDHRRTGRFNGLQNIDVVIGKWAKRRGFEIWYPYPSLCQHIGETSTLWPMANLDGYRSADYCLGEGSTQPPQ